MRVLMLGWEFPPYFAGGIGIVCYELTKALSEQQQDVTYLMPFGPTNIKPGFLNKLLVAEGMIERLNVRRIGTLLTAYMTEEEYEDAYQQLLLEQKPTLGNKRLYGRDLMQEVHNFAHRAMRIAMHEDFDVIHCHDWMTIPAAVGIKYRTGKPLVLHVHNTVYDRYLSGSNKVEYDIEQLGLYEADAIIAVSNYVKQMLLQHYDIDERKIHIIHNAAQPLQGNVPAPRIGPQDKIVLFAGRITAQKGPEYFVHAARKVADVDPNVKFVMAGTGDMLNRMIELSARLGLADKFLFPGFYSREDAARLFGMADVFVMPSVSEPFGIVPTEAMSVGTPVIISNQSGVSEVISHALKVDFWDTQQLAEKILAVLKYEELHQALKEHGTYEVSTLTWDKTAASVRRVYEGVVS